jgi:hypothetical protein
MKAILVGIPLAGILTLGTRKGCPYKTGHGSRMKISVPTSVQHIISIFPKG